MEEELNRAVSILKNGGIVILPTDTVWGIGASLERLDGISRLYQIKGREADKPTAILVADLVMAKELGEINQKVEELIMRYWPGGLTLVVKAKPKVPKEIRGSLGTVGLRQPNHQLTLKLLAKLGTGLVTASANFSGLPAPQRRELIDQALIDKVDFVLKGEAGGRPPSTVLDTTVEPFKVLRKGEIVVSGWQV